jgi:hypothetical protein
MPSIADILGNPLTDIMKAAGGIIDRFIPDPQKKIDASLELARLQMDMNAKLLAADVEWAKTQEASIEAETKSESWMARNWRPMTMLVFVFIIAYNFIFAQWWSLKLLPIPQDMWQLLKIGIGGYIVGRSAEKIVPATADAIVKAKAE